MPPCRVDELDCRLLKALFTGGTFFWRSDRILLGEVAERLGVHRNTIQNRLRRLEDAGIFLPLAPSVPSRALGLWNGRLAIVPPDGSLEAALDRIFAIEGVFRVVLNRGVWTVSLTGEDEKSLHARARLVTLVVATRPLGWESIDGPPSPQMNYLFDATATRILGHMLRHPEDGVEAAAERLSLSPRTVTRHLDRMRSAAALVMRPTRGGRLHGMTFTYARVAGGISPALLEGIETAAPDYYFRHTSANVVHLYLYAQNQEDMDRSIGRLRALPGLSSVDVHAHEGFYPNPSFDDYIARLLERRAEWAAGGAAAGRGATNP